MMTNCNYCGGHAFNIDAIPENSQIHWIYAVCVNCKAKYQIFFQQKDQKPRSNQGHVTIKDVTAKCPKCGAFEFESEWDKDGQQYKAVCDKCHYIETHK